MVSACFLGWLGLSSCNVFCLGPALCTGRLHQKPGSRQPLLRNVKVRATQEEEKQDDKSSAARQMMGMKGAAEETDVNKIRVQLTKPVTWIPLIWGELMIKGMQG